MRFMIIRKADKSTEAGLMPSEAPLAAMGAYNEELGKAGVILAGEGLHPSSKGARVRFSGGKPTVVDGPFAEARELIAGFTMIDVKSKAEAIEWVKRWPALDGDGAVELEIRQVFEASDFGAEFTPELREAEERLRADIATFTFAPVPAGTRVTWAMDGRNNFMAKAIHLFVDMDKMIGGNFQQGLAALKTVAERAPAANSAAVN